MDSPKAKELFLKLVAKSLFFDKIVAIFGKKYDSFSPKIVRRKKSVCDFKTKKKKLRWPLSSRGGGGMSEALRP